MGIATQICLLSCACTATAARFGAETLRNALGSPPKERRYAGAPPVVALQRQFDRYTAGFGLHYVDCGSYTAHTLAGRAFLMTNVPFLFAGSRLASAGQIGMGLSIALAGLLSHSYHARQLRYAGVEPEETAEGAEVRLAMMCDYGGALTAAVAGMATIAKRGGIALLRANPMLPLTVTAANACFVGGCGPLEARAYLIVHGMWHLFAASAGWQLAAL